jgi:hypothetical protein
MKLTSLSKSARTIGLMAMLSATVATAIQQPVRAQAIAQDDNGVCSILPEGVYYQEFKGITFSPEQKTAYREIEAIINARYKVISDNTQMSLITGGLIYTPAQVAEGKKIGRDFEAQTMTILTPEQQKIYETNLALQRRIQACDSSDQPFDRIMSPLPY